MKYKIAILSLYIATAIVFFLVSMSMTVGCVEHSEHDILLLCISTFYLVVAILILIRKDI